MPVRKKLLGIGIDLVSWDQIRDFLKRHRKSAVERLLNPSEKISYKKTSRPLEFFARCFSAKEAYFKTRNNFWMAEEDFRRVRLLEEGRNRFRMTDASRRNLHIEGRFFKTPTGVGARVFLWEKQGI